MKKISILLSSLIMMLFVFALANPAFASVSVIGELTRKYTVKPGGTYEGTIYLRNKGEKPQEVKIEKKDYLFYKDGSNKFNDPPSHPRSNAPWVTLTPSKATIPPGETMSVNFKIHVPNEQNLNGTYWSVIMVEPVEDITPETILKTEDKKLTMSLKVVIKHAIQIITDIGDTGTTKIKFLDKKVISKEGKRFLEVDIENTGDRFLTPQLWVEVFDQEGKSLGKFQGNKYRIFPGCSVKFFADISSIPKGKYKALIVADSSGEKIFGTRMNLDIE